MASMSLFAKSQDSDMSSPQMFGTP